MVRLCAASMLVACLAAGCSDAPRHPAQGVNSPTLQVVRSVTAEVLNLNDANVDPDATFLAMGADDLDVVEVVMEVEKKLEVSLSEDTLVRVTGVADASQLCSKLTVRTLASVAETAPRLSSQLIAIDPTERGVLQKAQVGTYEKLSRLSNPDRLVLVFMPSLEELAKLREQQLGRKLSVDETAKLRQQSVVMAVLPEQAASFERARGRLQSSVTE